MIENSSYNINNFLVEQTLENMQLPSEVRWIRFNWLEVIAWDLHEVHELRSEGASYLSGAERLPSYFNDDVIIENRWDLNDFYIF